MTDFLIWFSHPDRPLTLSERIAEAAAAHLRKSGVAATLCRVNPATLGADAPEVVGGVRAVGDGYVQENYFWIGVSDE